MRTRPVVGMLVGLSFASVLSGQIATPQYAQTNLVSNSTATAAATTIDPNLNGGWGLSESSGGPWWLSDNGSGSSTLYTGAGATIPLVVTVPTANAKVSKTGTPTGVIFNSNAQEFLLSDGKAASFLFATLDGLIVGWNGSVTNEVGEIAVNQNAGSMFTGLAVAEAHVNGARATYLYAADFTQGVIDVFDGNFNRVPAIESAIASIPVPEGYAPFNVQTVGANIYVTLAKQNKQKNNQVNGPGKGLVAAITPEGELVSVLETGKFLNAPWGVALAPGNFGLYSHDLLVANNGSGVIDVFNPITGKFIARLKDAGGAVIKIEGLWGISFGNDTVSGGSATALFFAAAPGTAGGLFGTLTPVGNPFGSDN